MYVRIGTMMMAAALVFGCSEQGSVNVDSSDSGLVGSCANGVTFEARDLGGVFDVSVQLHGMLLSAVLDGAAGVAEVDGFAVDNGLDTQINETDRAALLSCHSALERTFGEEGSRLESYLTRVMSLFAETPDTIDLQRSIAGTQDRGWTSICDKYNTYQYATHDGWGHDDWDADSTSIAHVGNRAGCTYWWKNGSWVCQTPDHEDYPYQYGECYGNCGAGCPSGNQQLTWDCHDHDQCVRNGHSIVSFWCNDEFSFAADDELFAPSCSGT